MGTEGEGFSSAREDKSALSSILADAYADANKNSRSQIAISISETALLLK